MVEQEIEMDTIHFRIPEGQIEQNQSNYPALLRLFSGLIKFSGIVIITLFLTYIAPILLFQFLSRFFGQTIFSLILTFILLMIIIILISLFKKKGKGG